MKLTIYFIFIFIFINSCQTKKISQDKDIIENIPFSKDNFYEYDYGYLKNSPKESDSFRTSIYTIVEPLDENKKYPKKINALPFDSTRFKSSIDFFKEILDGQNLSYLEINNRIVIREFYNDYSLNSKKNIDRLTSTQDLENYLESKKLNYKIYNVKKIDLTDIIDIEIQNRFYKIILNRNLCESYLFYNKKDTVNYNLYRNILIDFYR